STQGPNLYMLARLHARPEMKVEEVLDEYFSAFGKADPAVRAYFGHWEKTCNDVTEKPPGLHWTFFYREAHQIFTPVSMQKGKLLLDKAILAVSENAASDSIEKQRVEFLQKGLENARLTLAAQAALLQYRNAKGISELRKTIHDLDTFRASVEADLICNMNFLASTELKTWSRELLNPAPISEKDSRPFSEKNNPVKNGGMEREPGDWKKSVMHGRFTFSQDKTTAHSGKSSLKLQCLEMLDEKAAKKHRTRSWARWYQRGIPVEKGKACRLRLWVKTSKDFSGRVSIFVTGDAKKGTVLVKSLSTGGRWMKLLSPEIVPKENTLDVYLNLQDSGGTVWFDDVSLEVMAQP
ncbi:MAG: hypothetical protein KAG66_07070, partial [Methylococcales bacterium]|nr:hypothetical protein [Methylococcales bacterium]